jgi:hypothetical protein
MTKKKPIPWLEIKTEYLKGCSPKELAEKYEVDIKKLYKKIENDKWAPELSEIKGNIGSEVKEQISCITKLALSRLKDVLSDDDIRTSDLVQAIGKALDVSGLKSSKQEITGKDGSALIQKVYVSEKETEFTDNHIDSVINEQ